MRGFADACRLSHHRTKFDQFGQCLRIAAGQAVARGHNPFKGPAQKALAQSKLPGVLDKNVKSFALYQPAEICSF
jgi:hypothetical protein